MDTQLVGIISDSHDNRPAIEKAVDIFQRILKCDSWPAFGYIAAEVDLFTMDNSNCT